MRLKSFVDVWSRIVNVKLDIEEGGVYCWHGTEEIWDMAKYLAGTKWPLPEGLLVGSATLGDPWRYHFVEHEFHLIYGILPDIQGRLPAERAKC